MRCKLHEIGWLRRALIPLFSRINLGDITIRHHYAGELIKMHSYKHKGYWYHGKWRERETMVAFSKIIFPGNQVVEIGGHIGYITQWFSKLVGHQGRVVVFEPSEDNRKYLSANIAGLPNVKMRTEAVSESAGRIKFYMDNTGGQNNSILSEYEGATSVANSAGIPLKKRVVEIEAVAMDDLYREGLRPDLIKVDVEGAEIYVLRGARILLTQCRPALMIEVTNAADEVFALLEGQNYKLFTPCGEAITHARMLQGNIFGFDREDTVRIGRFLVGARKLE